jgi:hypothetical protein
VLQFKVLVANFSVANSVVSRRFASFSVDHSKAIIAQLVHLNSNNNNRTELEIKERKKKKKKRTNERIEESGASFGIHSELAILRVVIHFLHIGIRRTSNTHHPQELVNIVRSVS